MSRLSVRIGFWSAVLIFATFLVFTACFIGTFLVNPIFKWTDLPGYVSYVTTYNQIFKNVAQLSMLLFALLFIVLLNCLLDYAPESKRVLSRTAICFSVLFALLVSTHYFVQLSAVRLSILKGQLQGLEQIVQGNPLSAFSAMNMLGWTLFLGLTSLFIAPIFSGGKLEKSLRVLFILNGVFCILGGVGYVFDIVALIFLTINFGMGGAMLAISWLLAVLFDRMQKESVVR